MLSKTLSVDTSVLPNDVLTFHDDSFYLIVEQIAGSAEAKLLEIQGIRSVYSFLNTEDVFDSLSVSCSALNSIRKSLCLEADDRTLMVKPGCRSSIRYLHQLLIQKHEEHLKKITKRSKRNTNTSVQPSQNPSVDLSFSSGVRKDETTSNRFDEDNHRGHLVSVLNDWFCKNRHLVDISNQQLVENEDFQFSFVTNGGVEQVVVSCLCGVKVHLPKAGDRYSLSNYYKHLKTTGCTMIQKKKATERNIPDQSSGIDPPEHLNEEQSQNDPIVRRLPSSNSSISIRTTTNIGTSVKRSQNSNNQISSKRRRIRE